MELQRGIKRFAIGLFLLLFAVGFVPLSVFAAEEQGDADKIQITYYYFSSCESCEDGENYLLALEGQIEDAISPDEYEFHLKNVFEEDAYEDFMERTKDMATDEFTPAPPMLDVNGTCLFGVDDITNKARSVILEEKEKLRTEEERLGSFRNVPAESSYFVYFYVPACDDCEKVQVYLSNMDKQFALEQNQVTNLQVNYVNMSALDNVPLAHWFFDQYGVPEDRQKAPVLFYQNGYLQGYEDIVANMPNIIMSGEALNWEDIDYVPESQAGSFGWNDWAFLVVTGFANGLSPCGISLLLLLFSLLLAKNANILKLGLTFITARFLTFLLLGTVLYSAFEQISAILSPVGKALQILIAVLAVFFAILNFMDYFAARKNEYGKIRFQLPPKLRAFQRDYLENTLNCGGKYLTGTVFIAGIVLSVGEFLCTGQLYLASIIYMMQRQTAWDMTVFLAFVVYLLAMSLPLLLLTLLAKRGSQVLQLSEMTRGKLPWIKLLYGVLFLLFAVLLFVFLW